MTKQLNLRWDTPHLLRVQEIGGVLHLLLLLDKHDGGDQPVHLPLPAGITLDQFQRAWDEQVAKKEGLGGWKEVKKHDPGTDFAPFRAVRIINLGDGGFVVWYVHHKRSHPSDLLLHFPAGTDLKDIVEFLMGSAA